MSPPCRSTMWPWRSAPCSVVQPLIKHIHQVCGVNMSPGAHDLGLLLFTIICGSRCNMHRRVALSGRLYEPSGTSRLEGLLPPWLFLWDFCLSQAPPPRQARRYPFLTICSKASGRTTVCLTCTAKVSAAPTGDATSELKAPVLVCAIRAHSDPMCLLFLHGRAIHVVPLVPTRSLTPRRSSLFLAEHVSLASTTPRAAASLRAAG